MEPQAADADADVVGLGLGAGPALALTLRGHAANNTIVVRATGVASSTYSIDGGQPVRFTRIRSLTIDGVGGHDVCRIVNPPGGLFAPVTLRLGQLRP